MPLPSRLSAAKTGRANPRPDIAEPAFGEIRFPALKGIIAGSEAARAASKREQKERAVHERELPPILRKAAFED